MVAVKLPDIFSLSRQVAIVHHLRLRQWSSLGPKPTWFHQPGSHYPLSPNCVTALRHLNVI